ncbi:MAG: tRNA dihydrouridine(20/20a) synthase DusA [Gammaproteobacteria bacterium]
MQTPDAASAANARLPDLSQTRISVAPMMDRTDRHFRFFVRLIAPHVRLYSEMLTTGALLHGDPQRHLAFNAAEHPLALQLGGSEPDALAQAARMGEEWGYDEINLNIGCPSERVQSGAFGACLMAEPQHVADCVQAMAEVVAIPVTVKTRCGINEHDDYDFVQAFIATVAAAGCDMFIVHARKAILGGLSPRQNLQIPPLRYPMVYQLKKDFPGLRIILNGGVRSTAEVQVHLREVDGVMIGRQAYKDPYWLGDLNQFCVDTGQGAATLSRDQVLEELASYAADQLEQGVKMHRITRHILGLYNGASGARKWRRYLCEKQDTAAGPERIRRSAELMAGR